MARKNKSAARRLLKGLFALPLAIASGWIVYSKFFVDHDVPLKDAIVAQRVVYTAKTAVNLNYYVNKRGNGRPLVLIHSINAAASAYEMGPLFTQYQDQRPVYALDLPGYGFSDRPNRVYSPQYFAESILDFLETQVKEPADVVALSLSCEFVARAALAEPELFNSLALISPTGFTQKDQGRSQRAASTYKSQQIYKTLSNPLWGQALYDLIVTRPSLSFFLKKSFVGEITSGMIGYAYSTSHQTGAKNVPLYFVSGALFTPDIRTRFYEKIIAPTLVIYDRDGFSRFDTLPILLQNNANWSQARIVPSLGLPQFERLQATAVALDTFWANN
ncbi:MAG: alpha/beta hydrolase [Anaerolineales bacterium]|nr:alpha/beta hydrolase [Anaerolineales bacterium]